MTNAEVGRTYREAEVRGLSNVECVIVLYDMLVSDLRKGIVFLENGEIEERAKVLKHALLVLGQLQGSLQMESGGEAAERLYGLYSLARAKILEAQIKKRPQLLEEIIKTMTSVRAIWVQVRDSQQPVADAKESTAKPIPPSNPWQVADEDAGNHCNVWCS